MVTEKAEMRFFLEAGELWGWDSICLLLFLVTAEMPPPQEGLAEGPVFSITECCRLLPRHGSPFVITHLLSHLLSTTEALWKGQAGSFSLYPQMHHQRAQICYCSVVSDSLWPHGLQQARFLCPSPTPGAYSNSCLLSRWCHPTISSSVAPFSSCPPGCFQRTKDSFYVEQDDQGLASCPSNPRELYSVKREILLLQSTCLKWIGTAPRVLILSRYISPIPVYSDSVPFFIFPEIVRRFSQKSGIIFTSWS